MHTRHHVDGFTGPQPNYPAISGDLVGGQPGNTQRRSRIGQLTKQSCAPRLERLARREKPGLIRAVRPYPQLISRRRLYAVAHIDGGPPSETVQPQGQLADRDVQLRTVLIEVRGVLAMRVGAHQLRRLRDHVGQGAMNSHDGEDVIARRRGVTRSRWDCRHRASLPYKHGPAATATVVRESGASVWPWPPPRGECGCPVWPPRCADRP